MTLTRDCGRVSRAHCAVAQATSFWMWNRLRLPSWSRASATWRRPFGCGRSSEGCGGRTLVRWLVPRSRSRPRQHCPQALDSRQTDGQNVRRESQSRSDSGWRRAAQAPPTPRKNGPLGRGPSSNTLLSTSRASENGEGGALGRVRCRSVHCGPAWLSAGAGAASEGALAGADFNADVDMDADADMGDDAVAAGVAAGVTLCTALVPPSPPCPASTCAPGGGIPGGVGMALRAGAPEGMRAPVAAAAGVAGERSVAGAGPARLVAEAADAPCVPERTGGCEEWRGNASSGAATAVVARPGGRGPEGAGCPSSSRRRATPRRRMDLTTSKVISPVGFSGIRRTSRRQAVAWDRCSLSVGANATQCSRAKCSLSCGPGRPGAASPARLDLRRTAFARASASKEHESAERKAVEGAVPPLIGLLSTARSSLRWKRRSAPRPRSSPFPTARFAPSSSRKSVAAGRLREVEDAGSETRPFRILPMDLDPDRRL